jgi:hypothetical protein
MPLFFQRRGVRAARTVFRWCRITIWFAVLIVVAALAYLHLVGLPDFLKPPLLQMVRDRGFDARFTSARLAWGPAIFIENAGFSPTNRLSGPRLSAGLTEVKLNWAALLHCRLKADSAEVLNGLVKIPVAERYGKIISLDHVQLRMRLFSNDVAQLNDFRAMFRGIRIRIDGEVTNFASMADWKLPVRWQAPPEQTNASHSSPANVLDQFHFGQNSRLDIYFSADGRDINTLRADAVFLTPAIETPWVSASGFRLRAAAAHLLDVTHRPFVQARATANNFTTRWGTGTNAALTAAFFPDASTPFNAALDFAVNDLESEWESTNGPNRVRVRQLWWDGEAALSPGNFRPESVQGTLRAVGADSPWGSAGSLSFSLKADRSTTLASPDANWGTWTRLSPYALSGRLAATNIQSPKLQLDAVALEATWRAPQLAISNLDCRLYEGRLEGGAELNIDARELHLHAAADFNPHGISHVLTPAAQRWISQLTWEKPPEVNAQLRLILPPWTHRAEGWRNDLRSSVQIAGDFSVGQASFRKIDVVSASARFSYTNRVWNVPRLQAVRADGSINLDYTGNDATHEFHIILDSHLDPAGALPWLEPRQRQMMGELHFSTPPEIHADARGLWHDLESASVIGTVVANKFTARGVPVDQFHANIEYTNHFLRVSELGLSQGPGRLEVPLISADFKSRRILVTNVQSTLDSQLLLAAMGTNAPGFLNLIHFDAAPAVRAGGSFVLGDPAATDMQFEIQAGRFHWTNLSADSISATVFWQGRNILLTNVQARLYNAGKLRGWVAFDQPSAGGAAFRGDFTAKDIDLGLLARAISGKNSRVAGILEGSIALDAPITEDKDTWTGHGYIHVHDALLWDIKIFGVLSPLLNAISPGLGDSKVREATALFTIGGGKVSSDNLEIHSTGVRLLYRGSISMNKQINGRVEADLLRDTPVLGTLLSVVMTPLGKIFEYQITGPLSQPAFKPLYVPKFLMVVLRPFHTLKSLLPEDKPNSPATIPK